MNAVANRVTIVAAGGVEAVVQGMKAHVGVAAVQEPGVWALHNLAINGALMVRGGWWQLALWLCDQLLVHAGQTGAPRYVCAVCVVYACVCECVYACVCVRVCV